MEFDIVILDDHVSSYPKIEWKKWKDRLSEKMISEGDHWSRTILMGNDIWDCLDQHSIQSQHLVAWKPVKETLYRVSLPGHPHPCDQGA